MLLWFWHRPVAAAPIRPLTWEPPHAAGAALEKAKSPPPKKRPPRSLGTAFTRQVKSPRPGVPAVVQRDRWHPGSSGIQVRSPAWHKGLKTRHCCSCGSHLIPSLGTPYGVGQPEEKRGDGVSRFATGHKKTLDLGSLKPRLAPAPPPAFLESSKKAALGLLCWNQGWFPGDGFGGTGSGGSLSLGWGGRALLGPGQENPGGTHIAGQLLVVFHELLILLVDGQHLADAIGCCLGLATRQRESRSAW